MNLYDFYISMELKSWMWIMIVVDEFGRKTMWFGSVVAFVEALDRIWKLAGMLEFVIIVWNVIGICLNNIELVDEYGKCWY